MASRRAGEPSGAHREIAGCCSSCPAPLATLPPLWESAFLGSVCCQFFLVPSPREATFEWGTAHCPAPSFDCRLQPPNASRPGSFWGVLWELAASAVLGAVGCSGFTAMHLRDAHPCGCGLATAESLLMV